MAHTLTQSLQTVRNTSTAYRADDPDQLGDITCEMWVYLTGALTAASDHVIFGKDDLGSNRQWAFKITENGATELLGLRYFSSGGNGDVSVAITLTTSTWYHLAYTRAQASGDTKFYQNGVQIGTTQSTAAGNYVDTLSQFMVGARGSNSSIQDGLSANFSLGRVWSVVRTQSEIADNMCNVLGSTTNLLAEWTFNNTYNDNSGNSRTLTAQGSPTFPTNVPAVCAPVATSFPDLRLAFL